MVLGTDGRGSVRRPPKPDGANPAPHGLPSPAVSSAILPDVRDHPPVGSRSFRLPTLQIHRFGTPLAFAATFIIPALALWSLRPFLIAPMWYDEQWRADYISYAGGWIQGITADHVSSIALGWFVIERWSAELFGSTELSLRIPTTLFFLGTPPLLLLLVRRWMPLWSAFIVCLVASFTAGLVEYSIELKPYVVDFATIVLVLLLWEMARVQRMDNRFRRYLFSYLGIGIACLAGTATLFVIVPLLAVEGLSLLRSRRLLWFIPPTSAALIAGTNLLVMMHQNPPNEYAYWQGFYPPSGLIPELKFYWQGFASLIENGLAAPATFGHLVHVVFVVVWATLLVAGVVTVIALRRGVSLMVGLVGAVVLQAVAAAIKKWPFGYIRTNVFLPPLLVILAALGLLGLVKGALAVASRRREHLTHRGSIGFRLPVVSAALCVIVASGLGVSYEVASWRSFSDQPPAPQYGYQLQSAVRLIQEDAPRGAAVIVAGSFAVNGWHYYLFEHAGHSSVHTQIRSRDVMYETGNGAVAETMFVRRTRPSRVFLYVDFGSTGAQVQADVSRIAQAGYCRQMMARSYSESGLLESFERGGCAAT